MDPGPDSVARLYLGDLGAVMRRYTPFDDLLICGGCGGPIVQSKKEAVWTMKAIKDAYARAEQAEAELAECRTFTVEKVEEVEFLGRKFIEAEAELERLRGLLKEASELLVAWDAMWDDGQEEVEHSDVDVVLGLWSKNRRFLRLLKKPDA